MVHVLYNIFFIGLIFSLDGLYAQKAEALRKLQKNISALLDQPKFAAMRWGILVVAESGQVLFERDAAKTFIPASTMKLVTGAVALDSLGPDYTMRTSVYATRPIQGGVLHGNLIFYGRGDPTLSTRYNTESLSIDPSFAYPEKNAAIEFLADQIKSSGIKHITGSVIGDESFFSTNLLGPNWEWTDTTAAYAAEISALTINDNCISCMIEPGAKSGALPLITMTPKTGYVTVKNSLTTGDGGQPLISINRGLEGNGIELFGCIPLGTKATVIIPIHHPACFAATLLKEALERRGIRIIGSVASRMEGTDVSSLIEIAHITSPPLSQMLKIMNKVSQNLYAELLLRTVGVVKGGISYDAYGRLRTAEYRGNEVRHAFLQAAGVDVSTIKLHDGSGLARHNLLTPKSVVRLLHYMASHHYAQIFKDSLPIAALDGTLEQRMRGTQAALKVRAKTGSLGCVNALSGYVTGKKGQGITFSCMANNYVGSSLEVLQTLDSLCVLLAEYGD